MNDLNDLNELINIRDNSNSKIKELEFFIEESYNKIDIESQKICELNNKIRKLCNHKWDNGNYQKYSRPEYKCIKCGIIKL